MKYKKIDRIVASIFVNAIFLWAVWLTFQTSIWEDHPEDAGVKIFAIIGMIATLYAINKLIEIGTRIEDEQQKQEREDRYYDQQHKY